MRLRPRLRSDRERAYFEALSPSEQAAFLVGQLVGTGAGVPETRLVLELRAQLGDPRVPRCVRCSRPFVQRTSIGHPWTRCEEHRG